MTLKSRIHNQDTMLLLIRTVLLVVLFAATSLTAVLVFAQEETRVEIPATQFEPIGNTLVIPHLQIYPVLMIHDRSMSDTPSVYMSIYFRDCSQQYLRTEINSMVVRTPDFSIKIPFHITHRENEGTFRSPFEGMDENMLNEDGKLMLRTKQTYFLAEPEVGKTQNHIVSIPSNAKDLVLLLDFKLYGKNTPEKSAQHSFALRGRKVNDTIIRYANGDSSINQTITVPELPPSCLKK